MNDKVAICCIGRKENLYIKEFVEHYKNIEVDKIFIYDNNFGDEERFEDVLQTYIDEGFVDIVNYRDKPLAQLSAYQNCYDLHSQEYDWLGFIDCDEFLFLNKHKTIKDFLSQKKFENFDMIHLNWMCYGDNELIEYDDRTLSERFKNPIEPLTLKKSYNFPENDHIKSIVRGGLCLMWKGTSHTPFPYRLKCCDCSGKERDGLSWHHPFDYSDAYIKHYVTKTLEEWYKNKAQRGHPIGDKDYFKHVGIIDEFFKWNKKTKEKEDYIKKVINGKE